MLIRKATYDNLVQQCEDSKECIKHLELENADLITQVHSFESRLQVSSSALEQAHGENAYLSEELQKLRSIINRSNVEELSQSKTRLEHENIDLKDQLRMLTEKLHKAETELDSIRRREQLLQDEVFLQKNIRNLRPQLEQMLQEKKLEERFESEKARLVTQLQTYETQVENLKAELAQTLEMQTQSTAIEKSYGRTKCTYTFNSLEDLTQAVQVFSLEALESFANKAIGEKRRTETERKMIDSARRSLVTALVNIQRRAQQCQKRLALFSIIQDDNEEIPFDVSRLIANLTVKEICELDIWSKCSESTNKTKPATYNSRTVKPNHDLTQEYWSELRKYYSKFGDKLVTPSGIRVLRNSLLTKKIISSQVDESWILRDLKSIAL